MIDYKEKLEALKNLQFNWDGFDGIPPNVNAIRNAEWLLGFFHKSLNDKSEIDADNNGGVVLTFEHQDTYLCITFHNDGRFDYQYYPSRAVCKLTALKNKIDKMSDEKLLELFGIGLPIAEEHLEAYANLEKELTKK